MSLFCGTKVCLDSEMDLNLPAGEPDPTSFSEPGGFRDLDQAKQFSIEMPRNLFAARRNRELNMID